MGYINFFATRLFTEIGAADTVIALEKAPSATTGRLVLEARNPTQREIIRYTGVSGNQITGVVRGQGGTNAKPHLKNSLVEMNLTAEDLDDALNINGNLAQYTDELLADSIVSGTGVVTVVTGREVAISDIVAYKSGIRHEVKNIPNKTLPASQTHYIFVNVYTGAITITSMTWTGTEPSTPTDSILFAALSTNATTVSHRSYFNRPGEPEQYNRIATPAGFSSSITLERTGDMVCASFSGSVSIGTPNNTVASLAEKLPFGYRPVTGRLSLVTRMIANNVATGTGIYFLSGSGEMQLQTSVSGTHEQHGAITYKTRDLFPL